MFKFSDFHFYKLPYTNLKDKFICVFYNIIYLPYLLALQHSSKLVSNFR